MEPRWHRTVRSIYTIAFVLVWLEAVGCFVSFLVLSRGASPVATPTLAAGIVDHGRVFYVAAWQKQLYDLLLAAMFIGIPSIMLAGFILHYLVGVRIFSAKGRR